MNHWTDLTRMIDKDFDPDKLKIGGLSLGSSVKDSLENFDVSDSHGVWINTKQGVSLRHYNDEQKTLAQFIIHAEVLNGLKLQKESDIEKQFGPPNAIEKSMGDIYYFYPEKKMVVSWKISGDELRGIHIGESNIKPTEFSIRDFFELYQTFREMVPDSTEWNAKSLRDNEPRFYRLLALESLMKAFNIGTDLERDFLYQGFLKNRSIEDFEPILQDMELFRKNDEFEQNRNKDQSSMEKSADRYEMLIQNFMNFSFEVRSLLRFNSGWLEAGSIDARYSIHKTQNLLNKIDLKELNHIEEMLGKLLDPRQQTFTKHQLILNYDYPDVDLHKIDFDYW